MSFERRRDVVIGAIAGVIGGLLFAWAIQSRDGMPARAGLIGLDSSSVGLLLHLLVSAVNWGWVWCNFWLPASQPCHPH
ncbi:hypothetical protein MNBD_CHLOROFLEXI01-3379 [hydrothermal vent metagenome]|uniref:Uncharacterized protein n=1 Tax=hydrothermal vent metagenome TaxID=652676 RepID=A0A3B0W0I0_9ZZZZ